MITPLQPKPVEPYYPTVVDIETRENGDVFKIGLGFSFADDLHYETFDSWAEWLVYIEKYIKYMPTLRRMYAHNGGGFDWLSLVEYLVARGLADAMDIIYSDSIVIGINVKIGKHRIQLRDSLRLLPASLAKLSKTFDVPTPKLAIDCLPEVLYERDRAAFDVYLEHDVKGLQTVLYRFWQSIVDNVGNIGDLPMTLASLALRVWRMGLQDNMMVPWGAEQKAFHREAYFGGRTECFESGSFDVVVHDINSQYPSVMQNREYPLSYRGMWTSVYEGKHGIYRGVYSQPDIGLPALLRDQATGQFRHDGSGTFCRPELEKLLALGGRFECEKGYVFVDVGNPFKEFVDLWWGVRQTAISNGDDGLAFVCKILLNSLYGKFAQKENGNLCKLASADEKRQMVADGIPFIDYGDFVVTEEKLKVEHGFVALAAYITSYARLALYDAIERTYAAGGRVVYVDTDSIHAVGAELPASLDLGGLKIEYRGAASYAGRKLYALHGTAVPTVKAKGIGKLERGPLTDLDVGQLARDRELRLAVGFGAFPTWREVLFQKRKACRMVRRERTLRNTAPT